MRELIYKDICYIHSPNQMIELVPCIDAGEKIEPIPLKKRIIKVLLNILKIVSVLSIFLAFIIIGTILIVKFCPNLYVPFLLLVFMLGYLCSEIIFR